MSEKSPAKDKSEQPAQTEPPASAAGTAANQAEKALAEMTAAKAAIQADMDSIHAARAEAESIKGQVKTLHDGVASDLTSFTELKSRVTGLINNAEQKAKQISEEHESVGGQLAELKKAQKGLKEFLDGMEKTKTAAEGSRDAVVAAEQAVNQTKARFDELATHAQSSHSDLTQRQSDATAKAGEIETLFVQTQKQFDTLFKDEKDGNGNIVKKSVSTQLHELYETSQNDLEASKKDLIAVRTALAALEENTAKETTRLGEEAEARMTSLTTATKNQFDGLYKELKDRIESLLPGAGAAGLASTYFDAKAKYGFTPLKISEDDKHPNWMRIFHYSKTLLITFSFYAMFLVPLGGIAYIFWLIISSLLEHPDQLQQFNINIFILRLLITIPLGIISAFGWASIRLYRQMYEEYNHKQRVMQLYHSFKNEIAENGTETQKQTLLTIMLTAVGAKPDLGMHDQGLKEMFKSLFDSLPRLPGSGGGKPSSGG